MTTSVASFDSQHQDMIHDAQMDYYGKRLATCSSDKVIKIFNVVKNAQTHTQTHIKDLIGHEGPVWQIAWAHPKFGSKLASCSYDKKVIIWSEDRGNWTQSYVHRLHTLSVNSIAWAPHEFGLSLACGSSDGLVSIITQKNTTEWDVVQFPANEGGVNAVNWSPAAVSSSLLTQTNPSGPRLASAGCDNHIIIWQLSPEKKWVKEPLLLQGHTDWVRDVAWAPNTGLPYSTIASCSQDGRVAIWSQEPNSEWSKPKFLPKFSTTVWRVSWSVTGNILAVSCGDNTVTLWKESVDMEWKCISTLNEADTAA